MADTLKDFTVTCPDCNEEFEAGIPEAALLPGAEPYSVECPECGTELEIVRDESTQTVTLKDMGFEDDDEEDDIFTDVDEDEDDETD